MHVYIMCSLAVIPDSLGDVCELRQIVFPQQLTVGKDSLGNVHYKGQVQNYRVFTTKLLSVKM